MTLAEIRDLLNAEVLWADDLSTQVDGAAAADLMSDVLGLGRSGLVLLTALASTHAIRTAAIADIESVVFVRGKRPLAEVIDAAREAGIQVMVTPLEMLEAAGLLYAAMPRTEPCRAGLGHASR